MNKPIITNKDAELLTILMEECGEVIQECSKILRFDNNYDNLKKELGDLQCMIGLLTERQQVSADELTHYSKKKLEKLKLYSNLFEDTDEK